MKRLLQKIGVFVVLLVLAVLPYEDWRQADYWVFANLFMPQSPKIDRHLLLLELPDVGTAEDPRAFRELLGRTLTELARRHPEKVAVDIAVRRGPGEKAVANGIAALRHAGAKVYFGVLPTDKDYLAEHSELVYQRSGINGVGHTELLLCHGLVFFESLLQLDDGKDLGFLPALVVGESISPQSVSRRQVIPIPPDNPGVRLGTKVSAQGALLPPDVGDDLSHMTVLVASSERELKALSGTQPASRCASKTALENWTPPELLLWALSDLTHPNASAVRQPISDPSLVLAAALVGSAFALMAHLLGLRLAGRAWSPSGMQRRLWVVFLGCMLFLLGLLALIEWSLLNLGFVLPPAYPLIASLIVLGLCYQHTRRNLADLLVVVSRRATDDHIKADVDVFISYSHASENMGWVETQIVEPLRSLKLADGRPLKIFFDKSSITVGQDWFRRINLSILGSRCFLPVWSDDYIERDYCKWELDYAFPRAAKRGFLFLPVSRMSNPAKVRGDYGEYIQVRQYVDASTRPDFMQEVIEALRKHLEKSS